MACRVCGSSENLKNGRCGICRIVPQTMASGISYGKFVSKFGTDSQMCVNGMRACVVCGTLFKPGRSTQICCSKQCNSERKRGMK